MEIFTERMLLKDILPEKARDIAKEYKLKEDDIEFIRKKTPLKAEDLTIEDGERAAIRYVNTADLDRDNEIVMPSGGQVNDFKKSPTVLYAHDYRGLPIGKDIWIKLVQGKGWLAKTIYAKHQLASDVYNLVKEKFLNTSSIGFIPLERIIPENKGWDKIKANLISEYGIKEKLIDKCRCIYTKWILLEHSDVPIPSNISALNIAVGKGLEIKSKELIDDLEIEIIDDDKEKDVITKPEETADFIHIPVIDASKFVKDSFRTIDIDKKKGIKAVIGKLKTDPQGKTKVQKFIFDKRPPYKWTMKRALAWIKEHGKSLTDYFEEVEWDVDFEFEEVNWEKVKESIENEVIEIEEEDFDKELDNVIVKFHGSPRNPFGSHCSFRFKGGIAGYKKSWTLHCSQINGGALTPAASGPLRGTVRRIAMISAGMKPPCKVVEAEGIGARGGAKSPLPGTYPEKPSDYGLSSWMKPGDEGVDAKKATQFTCSDLNTIKRILVMEIKRRIKDRESEEGKGISEEEKEFFEGLIDLESGQQIIAEEETSSLEKRIEELKEKLEDIELKAGAVLNRKNKTDLTNAQKLIQNVLDSAETSEEGKAVYECECLSCGWKHTSEKHCDSYKCEKCGGDMRRVSRPGPGKEFSEIELDFEPDKKDEGIELDANEIKNIIKDVIKENVKGFKQEITKGIDDNFKRATGKVL